MADGFSGMCDPGILPMFTWTDRSVRLMGVISCFLKLLIYLLMAILGLCCYVWAFTSCNELGEGGQLFLGVCRFLVAVASLVAEHRL